MRACAVWSACQHVADNAPTSLSLAHRCVSRRARTRMLAHPSGSASPNLPSASLRRISRQSLDCLRVRSLSDPRLCAKAAQLAGALSATVGTGATALRGCVSLRAAPCGHFATLVRSIAAQSARLPSASRRRIPAQPPLVLRAASIRECGLHGLVGIPPCARMLAHPSGSASPNLPSDASHLRRICKAASRRLPCAGGGLRSGPARLRPSTCALSVHAISRAAQASPLAPLT